MKKLKLPDIAPYSGKRVQPFDGVKRYMSTGDLKGDNLSFEDVTYRSKPSRADILVSEGDILFAKMTNTNKALIIDRDHDGIIVSTGFSVHRPLENELCGEYFLHFLKHNSFQRQKNKLCTGAIQSAISNSGIEKIFVPVPELPDQLHIANLLSKAENLIAQRKESIRLLDEFLKSTFLEMFGDPVRNEKGWDKVCLGDVCKKIGSGSTPRGGKESYHKEGISLIRSLNVHNDEFVFKDLAFIDDTQAYELRNVIVGENDVLLNITGASVARCCIVPKEILPARVNQHVSILRPNNEVLNPFFLSRMLTAKTYQLKLVKDAKSKGATREAITKEELEQMKVIAPPIQLQTQFARIVEKTEVLKTQYQQSLQELENLYGSLSQKAFKGELTLKKSG